MKRKILIGVPLLLVGSVALIGVLHMPFARPLLGWIGYGCPVRASPEQVEAARMTSARAVRGTAPSPERPALGFELDRMTRGDVDAWVRANGITCAELQQGAVLRCEQVPATLLGHSGAPIDDLTFAFEPKSKRLVTVTTLRNRLDAATAAHALNTIAGGLREKLGEGRLVGTPTAQYLASGSLRTALVEYRFSDYIADVSATNLGSRVAVREHYMSAVD